MTATRLGGINISDFAEWGDTRPISAGFSRKSTWRAAFSA